MHLLSLVNHRNFLTLPTARLSQCRLGIKINLYDLRTVIIAAKISYFCTSALIQIVNLVLLWKFCKSATNFSAVRLFTDIRKYYFNGVIESFVFGTQEKLLPLWVYDHTLFNRRHSNVWLALGIGLALGLWYMVRNYTRIIVGIGDWTARAVVRVG